MKLTSTLLLVLNLALAIVLALHIASVSGTNIRQEIVASREAQASYVAAGQLNNAVSQLRAIEREGQQSYVGGYANLLANRQLHSERVLRAEDAAKSAEETQAQIRALDSAKTDVSDLPEIYRQLSSDTEKALANAAQRHDLVRREQGEALAALTSARASISGIQEDYSRLEYNLGLLSAEVRDRNELLYMYRWLRPDLQSEIGDNGTQVSAEVIDITNGRLVLNRGSRHGIELYQKYSIVNGTGTVVAVANVVEVRNGSAEAEIRSLPNSDRGMAPQVGHLAVPRQLNFALDNPGLTGR